MAPDLLADQGRPNVLFGGYQRSWLEDDEMWMIHHLGWCAVIFRGYEPSGDERTVIREPHSDVVVVPACTGGAAAGGAHQLSWKYRTDRMLRVEISAAPTTRDADRRVVVPIRRERRPGKSKLRVPDIFLPHKRFAVHVDVCQLDVRLRYR